MQAEILTIGDEILIGQIIDTNSAYISKALNNIGISVYQITTIQDDKVHIKKALQEAESNAEIIILTGGLGPTKDDKTKEALCEYFNDHLLQNDTVLKHIETLFSKYINHPLLESNRQQALVPTKAKILMNPYGSAPGLWFRHNNTIYVALPGVPLEMKHLIDDEVIPKLKKTYKLPYIKHITLLTYGLGESQIAQRVTNWEDQLPEFIKLAYLPNMGKVRLRLTAKGEVKHEIDKALEKQLRMLMPFIDDVFVGIEEDLETLEYQIGNILTKSGQTLSTAESFTGGKIAERLTSISGASKYFKGSVVSYATEIKTKLLNVPSLLIKEHSVVSKEVAEAMATNVLELLQTDYAIATTGNAGPTKGDSLAGIGEVYIAIATKNKVYAQQFTFGSHRKEIVNKATNKALKIFYKEILKKGLK